MKSKIPHYATSSGSSSTMVSSSREESINIIDNIEAKASNSSSQIPRVTSDNISSDNLMHNYVTSSKKSGVTSNKESSVVLDFLIQSPYCPSEKSTDDWRVENSTENPKEKVPKFNPTEVRSQEQFINDLPPSSNWLSVLSSGLTPFGSAEWPPCMIWIVGIMTFLVISGELLLSRESAGEFLELKPFNYMLGPSVQILIQTGARFPPCMRNSTDMPPTQRYVCINATTAAAMEALESVSLLDPATSAVNTTNVIQEPTVCSLEDICGFGGFANPRTPDQAYRFLTPLFVHSGILHWGINMVVLMPLGYKLEQLMSGWRFGVQYMASGIFGNVFGANFAPSTTPTLGCSTSIFGLMACLFVDLIYQWHSIISPARHLIKLIVYTTIGLFVLGILPGVDSFSNIGGLLGGLLIAILMVPYKRSLSRSRIAILWTVRLLGLIVLLVLLGALSSNFYTRRA